MSFPPVDLDELKYLSQLSSSITQIHMDSPFLDEIVFLSSTTSNSGTTSLIK